MEDSVFLVSTRTGAVLLGGGLVWLIHILLYTAHKSSLLCSQNENIARGCTIVAGINYGLYARAYQLDEPVLRMRSTKDTGEVEECEFPMDENVLSESAKLGGFWSYAAGVSYIVATEFQVKGLYLDNYKTTLPLKKGLSSSAAFCVLVARAFNECYGIGLTQRGEMRIAYEGERLTPSQCGRMDQAVAFGQTTVKMIYDGDLLRVERMRVGETLYMVLVDLKASKDTVEILSKLQRAYPTAQTEADANLHRLLGDMNLDITDRATMYLAEGDMEKLGRLMSEAQEMFDEMAGPMCPNQLGVGGSPVLHQVLSYEPIQEYIYGGKGVGSQGDGSAQFVCKSAEAQEQVVSLLHASNEFDVSCMTVTLPKTL